MLATAKKFTQLFYHLWQSGKLEKVNKAKVKEQKRKIFFIKLENMSNHSKEEIMNYLRIVIVNSKNLSLNCLHNV